MTGQEPTAATGSTGATGPRKATELGFARRNAWVLAIGALLALIAVVTGATWAGQRATLDGQESRIVELQERLSTAELKNSARVEEDDLTSLGVARSRLDADAPIIAALTETVFTWDSGTAYEQARTRVKAKYDLAENDTFLKDFMPPSRYNEDADGKRYYYIDTQGLNSSVSGDPQIDVVKVAAGDYTYAVVVDVAVTSDSLEQNNAAPGRVTADRRLLLFVTVNADGGVLGLSGVPTSGSTRHSG